MATKMASNDMTIAIIFFPRGSRLVNTHFLLRFLEQRIIDEPLGREVYTFAKSRTQCFNQNLQTALAGRAVLAATWFPRHSN